MESTMLNDPGRLGNTHHTCHMLWTQILKSKINTHTHTQNTHNTKYTHTQTKYCNLPAHAHRVWTYSYIHICRYQYLRNTKQSNSTQCWARVLPWPDYCKHFQFGFHPLVWASSDVSTKQLASYVHIIPCSGRWLPPSLWLCVSVPWGGSIHPPWLLPPLLSMQLLVAKWRPIR